MNFLYYILVLFTLIAWVYMMYRIFYFVLTLSHTQKFSIQLNSSPSSFNIMPILAIASSIGLLFLAFFAKNTIPFLHLMGFLHIPWIALSVVMPRIKKQQISFLDNEVIKVNQDMDFTSLAYEAINKIVIRSTTIDFFVKEKSNIFLTVKKEDFTSDMDWLNLINYLTAHFREKTVNKFPLKKPDIIAEIMKDEESEISGMERMPSVHTKVRRGA